MAEWVTRRHRRIRKELLAAAGGACVVCGYARCALNLHFHHVVPAEKSFNMTMASGKSLAAYTAEAQKCILVCANCHGEIEAGVIPCPPLPPRA
jgi:5-methylcytosine-specific restriction endonuclease McrA